ncbi:MAG: glycine cleavage system aminomethyltransferase GcvT [Pontimonas sp.]
MGSSSPLHRVHEAAGAAFTEFGGWLMPVRYSSDLAEHHAVRTGVGLFDLSHMAEIRLKGSGAADVLDYSLSSRLSTLEVGQAKYSLMLAEDAGIIDDVVVYRLAEDDFLVVANASNRDAVFPEFVSRAQGFDVVVSDETDETAMVAVQGPKVLAVMSAIAGFHAADDLETVGYYRITRGEFDGVDILVARTGYTGEDGFEIYVPVAKAEALWAAIVAAGASVDLELCGLAARDTLRLEAGMALYGHEINRGVRPAEARLSRVVDMDKESFVGKEWLEQHTEPSHKILVGIQAEGKRSARAGYPVVDPGSMEPIGEVTSGALSPTLGFPIAMALIDRDHREVDTEVHLDVRGTMIPARVVALPFYRRRKD